MLDTMAQPSGWVMDTAEWRPTVDSDHAVTVWMPTIGRCRMARDHEVWTGMVDNLVEHHMARDHEVLTGMVDDRQQRAPT